MKRKKKIEMEYQERPLKNKWVLWFHRVDDDKWTEDTYKKCI